MSLLCSWYTNAIACGITSARLQNTDLFSDWHILPNTECLINEILRSVDALSSGFMSSEACTSLSLTFLLHIVKEGKIVLVAKSEII